MLTKAVHSSNFNKHGDLAPNAIDGNMGTQSATKREKGPWLEITFQEYSLVRKVINCCEFLPFPS